jgi:hypothetical protein
MGDRPEFHRWSISVTDLYDLTEAKARDIIVRCFVEAQKETFHQARERLGASTDQQSIEKSMATSIRMVFKEVGYDYDSPTLEGLEKVVDRLARSAQSWGTPEEVVLHHKTQIEKVLRRLRENAAKA